MKSDGSPGGNLSNRTTAHSNTTTLECQCVGKQQTTEETHQ